MQDKFELIGLNRVGGDIYATITYSKSEDTCHADIHMAKDRKEALWNYCQGNWGAKKTAIVRHEGLVNCCPINPVVIEVIEMD